MSNVTDEQAMAARLTALQAIAGEGPPWWCQTCESWRHTQPCGRDECPVPTDRPQPVADGQSDKVQPMECEQAMAARLTAIAARLKRFDRWDYEQLQGDCE